jgi:cytochrome bd-type quinol oxidase subunit 2
MIRKLFLSLSLLASFAMPLALPVAAHAAQGIQQNLCAGANLDVNTDCNSGGITNNQAQQRINDILHSVINLFSLVVGVVSVIMIILGGLKYITSGGNDSNVSGAKNTIIYAIVGIVIVALAQFIVRFVLTKVTQ